MNLEGADSQHVAAAPPPPALPQAAAFLASGIGIIVAVLSLPVVLVLDGPIAGWVMGVVLWSLNWGGQILTTRVSRYANATTAVGMSGISFISRAWLTAIVLFIIALKYDETVGLVAAAVFLVAFTLDLAGRTVLFAVGQQQRKETSE
jgi:hypothetical protein